MENVLGTSDLLWYSMQGSVGHSYWSFENAIRSNNLGKREWKLISLKKIRISLNKRNKVFVREQSREDVTLFEIISKLHTFYTREQPLA
jgi:hypothetical protein